MGLEQYKYFVFCQDTDDPEDKNTIFNKQKGIGYWMILQAENFQQAWDYLMELGKGIDDYKLYETVEECECCGRETVEKHNRWGRLCQYKELNLENGVGLKRLALVYEPGCLDHTKGFIHKINGDFVAFYADVNFFYPFNNNMGDF